MTAGPSPGGPLGTRIGFGLALVPPLLAGAALRLFRLSEQVLGGDELHAVRAVVERPASELFFTYVPSDPCLPVAGLLRLLMDWGFVLSETAFRLPSLLPGLLSVLLMPLLLEARIGRRAAVVLAWLLAISPGMVFYSRIARSYALETLLAFLAVLAFFRWLEMAREAPRRKVWALAAAYAVLAALAVWVHLLAAPVVAAPFAFAAIEKLAQTLRGRRKDCLPRWRDFLALGGLSLLALATFLVPAAPSLWKLTQDKAGAGRFEAGQWLPTLMLQAGTDWLPLVFLTVLLSMVGAFWLWRRQRRFLLYTLTLMAAQLVGLQLLSPLGLGEPLILNRYLLVLTPFWLLLVAVALAKAGEWKVLGRGWLGWAPAAAMILLLFLGGPFAEAAPWRTSFLHHNDFLRFYEPRARVVTGRLPNFYGELAGEARLAGLAGQAGEGAVLEFPVRQPWRFARTPYVYQEVHHRPVLISSLDPYLCDPCLRLERLICARPEAFLASGARYLVVHLDPQLEEEALEGPDSRDHRPNRWRAQAREARRLVRLLSQEKGWGAPRRDGTLRIWDLRQVQERLDAAE